MKTADDRKKDVCTFVGTRRIIISNSNIVNYIFVTLNCPSALATGNDMNSNNCFINHQLNISKRDTPHFNNNKLQYLTNTNKQISNASNARRKARDKRSLHHPILTHSRAHSLTHSLTHTGTVAHHLRSTWPEKRCPPTMSNKLIHTDTHKQKQKHIQITHIYTNITLRTHTHTHTYIHTYAHTHKHTHTNPSIYLNTQLLPHKKDALAMSAYISVCLYVCLSVCLSVCLYVCVCVRVNTPCPLYTHTHILIEYPC